MSNSSLISHTNLSPNGYFPRNHAIDTITIHCFVGQVTVERGCNSFKAPGGASCNYVVGLDGRIGLALDEKNGSWCTSNRANDMRAVTIEVASDSFHPYAITDAAMVGLINLCADICKRNGIKQLLWRNDKGLIGRADLQNMTVHRWFANKACPGDYIFNRLTYIADEVNKILNGGKPMPIPEIPAESKPVLRKGNKGAAVIELQQKLIVHGYKLPKYGADGDFGTETVEALTKFQEDKGLGSDGVCGASTWKALLGKIEAPVAKPEEPIVKPEKPVIKPEAPTEGTVFHIVKSGESLSLIAKNYGTTVEKILALNPSIKNKNLIYSNQKIIVKGAQAEAVPEEKPDEVIIVEQASFAVGDIVYFKGGSHYSNTNAAKAVNTVVRPGKAKITRIAKGKYPCHVIHIDKESNVYGWVAKSSLQ